jgi:hypothetical protein
MATQNAAAPYDVTLRRGRITLLAIIILIAASEIAILALTLGFRGWQTGWRAGFGAVLTLYYCGRFTKVTRERDG